MPEVVYMLNEEEYATLRMCVAETMEKENFHGLEIVREETIDYYLEQMGISFKKHGGDFQKTFSTSITTATEKILKKYMPYTFDIELHKARLTA